MYYSALFIECHPVSPQAEKYGCKTKDINKNARKWDVETKRKKRDTSGGNNGETTDKEENLYYAELRASCFCPRFLVFP